MGFITIFFATDRASILKISKSVKDLNNIINQLDLIDICSTLHPTTSRAHGIFTKIDQSLDHKISFKAKFKY